MTVRVEMPRYVTPKALSGGRTGFYWTCPSAYRKEGFPIKAKPLGINLSQRELDEAAIPMNAMLDEWRRQRNADQPLAPVSEYGTVAWLFRTYLREDAFLERVDAPNRADYERAFNRIGNLPMKSGKSFGEVAVSAVTVKMAIGIYGKLADSGALRGAEKALTYCKAAWKRMKPIYPSVFPEGDNPWEGVTLRRREKTVKTAVTRDEVYQFARGALKLGRPQCAAAAVICFEWLMRPRNVSAGLITWSDYRGSIDPQGIRVRHKKNRQTRIHPLEFDDAGTSVRLYAEAEEILAQVPRWGLAIVCNPDGKPYGENSSRLTQIVSQTAKKLGMDGFTMDACRHGGMTELEESELTDGQGRALSAHQTRSSYAGYAKETRERMLTATLRRREARLKLLEEDAEAHAPAARSAMKNA
ncbi:site-specific integrase [Mangrovibrevibacter kandeliae]|uniref:hypothetical protein n=1 Tax=Mangrovibrevibacter kandeliae TaxID=2968473 RepID=UPI002118E89C|nr:hypothetical protein [Aurantimonas sp. CSK15Z-1]MCQ8781660.1 hypothetical protein [Aurantimonas sp. CSK15Z-1]